ncbi:MAG: hypothetical protein HY644_07825 [Acidobacteria bacterium]|nr:hypothetical protein [Acidobacteriota bacterium]
MNTRTFRQDLGATLSGGLRRATVSEILSVYGALLSSFATLVCCALPALLVLLGFGVTSVLTFLTAIPGWQDFSSYEIWLFPLSGILLAAGFYFAYFRQNPAQGEVCEIAGGGQESACSTTTRWNRRLLWFSVFLYSLALVTNFWGIGWMKAHGYFDR